MQAKDVTGTVTFNVGGYPTGRKAMWFQTGRVAAPLACWACISIQIDSKGKVFPADDDPIQRSGATSITYLDPASSPAPNDERERVYLNLVE